MTTSKQTLFRRCPQCGSQRPVTETECENLREGLLCAWPLTDVDIVTPEAENRAPETSARRTGLQCHNGHPVGAGDAICLECGADVAHGPAEETSVVRAMPGSVAGVVPPTRIGDWEVLQQLPSPSGDAPCFTFDARGPSGREVLLTLYRPGAEPDPAVHDVLKRMALEHMPELIETGRHEGRAYEVTERVAGGNLAESEFSLSRSPEGLRLIVEELGRALASFAEVGLRHRDLHPRTILLRSAEPLDLVITGFGSARLSDFDLEAVAPLELTRYSAPEAIVGAVSASSDWWSLGMVVLEQATSGQCFEGIDDQAFRLHVVTRGVFLPDDLDPSIRLLLRGLLARDPLSRWSAPQVRTWLAGEPVDAPEPERTGGQGEGPSLNMAGCQYWRPDTLALAAAEAGTWDAARELMLRGAVATWLEERGTDPTIVSEVRRLAADEALGEDIRLALVLMAMNSALPFILRGEIVTPAWLLAHPVDGYGLVTGNSTGHLERMGREPWLVRLRSRAEAVRERARLLEIELDEERTRIAVLATSRPNLEAERDAIRAVYPDSDHAGLLSLLERGRLSDEDLIVLIAAASHQFVPLASLVAKALELGAQTGVAFDPLAGQVLLARSRRDIFFQVDDRIANFARCSLQRIDEWADSFRVERRMPLPRAAVLLAVPAERWQEPPRQQYVATLLSHFEKRVSGTIAQGPLARFTIGKTTPRLDLAELGTPLRPAEAMLNHVLARSDVPITIDPQGYLADENREVRLRRLVSHAMTFRRDTGLDGRTLGFPFVLIHSVRATTEAEAKPRIAPVLLWPVVLDLQAGTGGGTLAFDREREEVRLNPALEGILGPQEFQKWRAARDELLGRSAIRIGDVVDVFGALSRPRSRSLTRLPSKDAKVPAGTFELVPAAALFNAEFMGQSVAEDLRQMARMPPAGTGLDAALRISAAPTDAVAPATSAERDRYLLVESDPSQEAALHRARQAPGLLVEGPPGTGKSQTIVNVVADAIGRGESVLVVCQKQAALQVVRKRLEAEDLGDRLFMVVDVNRDRETILRSLRDQIPAVRDYPSSKIAALRRQRLETAMRIEALEAEVDKHHRASRSVDDLTGMSHRDMLAELIAINDAGRAIAAPGLRPVLEGLDFGTITAVVEECASLARLWLDAAYEDSPLEALKTFLVDPSVAQVFADALEGLQRAETHRRLVLTVHAGSFDVIDRAAHVAWIEAHGAMLEGLPEQVRIGLAAWLELFRPMSSTEPGRKALEELEALGLEIGALNSDHQDATLSEPLTRQPPALLDALHRAAERASRPTSLLGRLNPLHMRAKRRVVQFLSSLGEQRAASRVVSLRDAAGLELRLRALRQRVGSLREILRLPEPDKMPTLMDLAHDVRSILAILGPVASACEAVFSCPRPAEAEAAASAANPKSFLALRRQFEAALARYDAREASKAALQAMAGWLNDDVVARVQAVIDSNGESPATLGKIAGALGTLEAYQRFRVRVSQLKPELLQCFRVLRKHEIALRVVRRSDLEEVVRRSLRREALLAWKGQLEAKVPELLFESTEIESKVGTLAALDGQMRSLNKDLLRFDIDAARLGSSTAWDDITRLRGPRARRLREIIDQGGDLGLMRLRPIWLMNPDVASRILPLKAGLFDVVIYDEASQMLVEHAVPTLFRAKRILVVGDEKQMPPSSFFSGRIDENEDDAGEGGYDEGATEAERSAQVETWNRREVKDCPDLLQLGRGVLPTATLQIHYRSKYRELIGYSNSAFYQGQLSVPVRHPDAEICRVRPVEVVRVDGRYEGQTNRSEAEQVVAWLAHAWSEQCDPPSIGVVTFNRKQADLVEELVEKRAAADEEFLRAYRRERDRKQGGEDMGFFVKNVENVQGDERDVIVFSTTFGRDRHGTFRRNFGVLGQTGGERRLNVAVTRAREKVVLVTSMPVGDVSDWLVGSRKPDRPRDYLQAYLHYAERMSAGDVAAARATAGRMAATAARGGRPNYAADDGFARSVSTFVGQLGYTPVPASEGDAFGIDFAVEDPRTGLFGIAIECDAPHHDLLNSARAREIWRPAVLQRAIPVIHRVSSHGWYHRPEHERGRLETALRSAIEGGH